MVKRARSAAAMAGALAGTGCTRLGARSSGLLGCSAL
jgi:hypothetical protein